MTTPPPPAPASTDAIRAALEHLCVTLENLPPQESRPTSLGTFKLIHRADVLVAIRLAREAIDAADRPDDGTAANPLCNCGAMGAIAHAPWTFRCVRLEAEKRAIVDRKVFTNPFGFWITRHDDEAHDSLQQALDHLLGAPTDFPICDDCGERHEQGPRSRPKPGGTHHV